MICNRRPIFRQDYRTFHQLGVPEELNNSETVETMSQKSIEVVSDESNCHSTDKIKILFHSYGEDIQAYVPTPSTHTLFRWFKLVWKISCALIF